MPPKTRSTTARKPAARKAPAKRKKARRKIVKAKITIALFNCKRCRKPYNLPWRHVCLIGATPAQRAAALKNLAAARQAKKSRRWW